MTNRGLTRPPGPLRSLRLAVLLVLAGLAVFPVGTAQGDELSDARARQRALERSIQEQQARVAELSGLQATLGGDLAATRTSLAGVNADLAAMRVRVSGIVAAVGEAQRRHDELVGQIASLDAQLVQIQAEEALKAEQLADRKAQLAARIRNAYDADRTSLLEVLLSSDSFADALADATYHVDVATRDRALARQIAADQQVLAELHATVATTREQTDQLRLATARQKARLDSELANLREAQAALQALEAKTQRLLEAQTAAYAKLNRSKADAESELAEQAGAEQALQSRIDQLVVEAAAREAAAKAAAAAAARKSAQDAAARRAAEEAANDQNPPSIPSTYNGTLIWPMRGVITQEFGCTGFSWEPPLGSCANFHRGIDIAAPLYTPIRAAGAGQVVFAGENFYDSYPRAWIVVIAHSATLKTWYAHVDNVAHPPVVRAGQYVRAGQVIAYEGMTGRTTGPHLHWMVQLGSSFANPRLFL